MAFTRKFLKALGITDDQVESIIDAHAEVVEGLKKEIEAAKADTANLEAVTKERDDLMHKVEELQNAGTDAAKVQAEFDAYKQQIDNEKVVARKNTAVRSALKAAGAQEVLADLLMGKVNLDDVELDGENVKDTTFIDTLKTTFPTCFAVVSDKPAPAINPPTGGKTEPEDPFLSGFKK